MLSSLLSPSFPSPRTLGIKCGSLTYTVVVIESLESPMLLARRPLAPSHGCPAAPKVSMKKWKYGTNTLSAKKLTRFLFIFSPRYLLIFFNFLNFFAQVTRSAAFNCKLFLLGIDLSQAS